MATIGESPVGQFRSNVQWFLEGNTPSYRTELVFNLQVDMKTLANQLRGTNIEDSAKREAINRIAEKLSGYTRHDLENTSGLKELVSPFSEIVGLGQKSLTENKYFRDALVQLIQVAETHSDISLKKQVLELTNKL